MFRILKNVTVADPQSAFNNEVVDLLLEDDCIQKIGKVLEKTGAIVIDGHGKYISPGWVDGFADYSEPGEESKETLKTGLATAANGGFAEVILAPNTHPAVTNEAVVSLILSKSTNQLAQVSVTGAISKDLAGKELAEMLDMHHAGAVAFTDGWSPVQNDLLVLKALEYVREFDGLLIQLPIHENLASGGLMNEGKASVRLGMSGIPPIGESIMVNRDLEIAGYTNSKIHFSGISTKESLALIQSAKQKGIKVSCSVTPFHLLYNEDCLEDYDNVFKVNPPLRTEEDRLALVEGVRTGIVDCIASHHHPQNTEAKAVEFEYAGWGMACQETCWNMLTKALPELSRDRLTTVLSIRPREIFGLNKLSITEGAKGKFTLFDFDSEWNYSGSQKKSRAINNPFIHQTLKGKALVF